MMIAVLMPTPRRRVNGFGGPHEWAFWRTPSQMHSIEYLKNAQ
jgi:hypothetical protein